jgi:thioredoxin 1
MSVNGNIVEITDQNFAETIEGSTGLTMIDFWAEWCGPCRTVAPIVKALADEYADQGVTVGKLDVDSNPDITVRFAVRSIPSVLFFKDGEHVDTVVGAVPRPTLEAKIKEHL